MEALSQGWSSLTVLGDGTKHTLQDIIVDDNMQQTEAVEVAPEWQGQNGGQQEHLRAKSNWLDRELRGRYRIGPSEYHNMYGVWEPITTLESFPGHAAKFESRSLHCSWLLPYLGMRLTLMCSARQQKASVPSRSTNWVHRHGEKETKAEQLVNVAKFHPQQNLMLCVIPNQLHTKTHKDIDRPQTKDIYVRVGLIRWFNPTRREGHSSEVY